MIKELWWYAVNLWQEPKVKCGYCHKLVRAYKGETISIWGYIAWGGDYQESEGFLCYKCNPKAKKGR